MNRKCGLLGLLCLCTFVGLSGQKRALASKKDEKKVSAGWAKKAQSADVIRIIGRASSAVKGFDKKGKKLTPAKRTKLVKSHIKQLSKKPAEILKDTAARRELFNISIRDSILGLLLSIQREAGFAKITSSKEFKKIAKIVGFTS
ncbi:hypothetical protein KAU11_04875 [Candidatus Babeliales bacterium]|nr:hypothetical protein [Candidatus Babeliales bacterium]